MDETGIKACGKWKSLFRAIDKAGRTPDFYLSVTRSAKAAKRFLAKALKRSKHNRPGKIDTNKNPAYGEAIREKKGLLAADCHHRQVKYLNKRLESGHGKLKRLIKPTLSFQSMRTA